MARFGQVEAQYFDDAGDPLSSGTITFYETGTTTLKTTYADINYTVPNTNPVVLTAAGRQPAIFFDGVARAILATSAGSQIIVADPVGETSTNFGDAWVATKIYGADAVVIGSDGVYYRSLAAGNQNQNPTSTSGYWSLLYSIDYSVGITYAEGANVTYLGILYQSLQSSNLNNTPSSSSAYWVPINLAWRSSVTYALHQNVVGSDGIFYTSLQNSNLNKEPSANVSYWVGTSAAAAGSATTASEWATKNDAAVSGSNWSAFANASGAAPTGSSKAWATTPEDSVVTGGEYSAKHYSEKSSASATASSGSATSSANSATASAASETAAAASQTASAASETAAAASQVAAAASQSAAATSATSAANKYDEFDDRYLGQKSSDPTTDNDGNALVTGALYFNTASNVMKVYNGSSWQITADIATSITVGQISDFPSQSGHAGKLLSTNGSALSWSVEAEIPSMTGQSGKYLKTDGSTATWQPVTSGRTDIVIAGSSGGDYVVENAYEVMPSNVTITGTWQIFTGTNVLETVEPTSIGSIDDYLITTETLSSSKIFYKIGYIADAATITVNSGVIMQGVGATPVAGSESSGGGGTVDTFRTYGELMYFGQAS